MDDPEKKEQNIAMSELNPKRLLEGATPRLIDEWQLAPKLWDAIRFEVDHRRELLVEEGVESLKTMQAKIDTGKMKAPSFLMVLTGTGDYAYCRRDGVYVVPIGCLKN